ncbi:hypothetical protein [Bacillus pseudomycoides]|uniref:hypothetical protein n=1 Tax=Bacillus pseudomycoides TaxID=64104 RepID=UPI002FFDE81B
MEMAINNFQLIEAKSLNGKLQVVEENKVFKELQGYLKAEFGKEVTILEHKGIEYDILNDRAEKAEVHYLLDTNSNIRLLFGLATNKEGKTFETATVDMIVEENGHHYIKMVSYDVETKQFVVTYSEKIQQDVEAAWVNMLSTGDRPFEALKAEPEMYKAKGFFDFCLPGGYKWCGQGCGKATGGGALKNKIDGCCFIHDDCYDKYSSNRCANWDKSFVSCISNRTNYATDPATASAIIIFFQTKCYF